MDGKGRRQVIDSADVHAYLREICGEDFTAKDFRTWAGTVLAARALADTATFKSSTEAKRNVAKAVEAVAKRLGNTKSVCRKGYIHPAILEAYLDGAIGSLKSRADHLTRSGALSAEERARRRRDRRRAPAQEDRLNPNDQRRECSDRRDRTEETRLQAARNRGRCEAASIVVSYNLASPASFPIST